MNRIEHKIFRPGARFRITEPSDVSHTDPIAFGVIGEEGIIIGGDGDRHNVMWKVLFDRYKYELLRDGREKTIYQHRMEKTIYQHRMEIIDE